jgi:lipoyl(octanoyl) transferase
MPVKVVYENLGIIDYKKAWDYQEKLHKSIVRAKTGKHNNTSGNRILFCEHPHVYTIGKSGSENNLLINKKILDSINATYYRINRGGDITYHGPGQIVGYPIFDLEQFSLGVKKYVFKIEESIIKTLREYNISAERIKEATGVWLDADVPGKTRKICAIGIRVSKYVTMHGFALNVNNDLNYFNYINPCGYNDMGVTSIKNEIGYDPGIEDVKKKILDHIIDEFKIHVH